MKTKKKKVQREGHDETILRISKICQDTEISLKKVKPSSNLLLTIVSNFRQSLEVRGFESL